MPKICLFILVVFCSDVLTLIEGDFNEFSNTKTPGNNVVGIKDEDGDVDYKKRKEIVENYIKTLNKEEEGWVDPYDMISHDKPKPLPSIKTEESNIDSKYKPEFSDIRGEVIGSSSVVKDETDTPVKDSGKLFSNPKSQICVLDSIYISRWLKMLIMKIETDSYFEPTSLVIPLNSDSLSELKAVSTKSINIAELDELVSNLISKTMVTSKEMFDWTSFTSNFVYGVSVIIGLAILGYFLYIFIIVRPVWTLIVCLIFINFFWHWMHLYQKQVAHKHSVLASKEIPSECRKNDFGFFESISEYFKSFFRTSDCTKYYEALMVDPFWEVSLSVAISEAISAMIFQPLYTGSKALNAAVKNLFNDLPLSSICIVVVFLFLFIIMRYGYRIKFPFFMGALEPGHIGRRYVEDVKPTTLDSIKDLVQKSTAVIEKADRNISGLLQDGSLHKRLSSDSLKKNDFIENVISKQVYEKGCKSVDCFGHSKVTCEECEKSLEFASNEQISDQESKVGREMERYNFCQKHSAAGDKNSVFVENDRCTKYSDFTVSNYKEPNDLADTVKDDFSDGSCSACESNKRKQKAFGISLQNNC